MDILDIENKLLEIKTLIIKKMNDQTYQIAKQELKKSLDHLEWAIIYIENANKNFNKNDFEWDI